MVNSTSVQVSAKMYSWKKREVKRSVYFANDLKYQLKKKECHKG